MNIPANHQTKHVPARLAAALIQASKARRNTYIDMLNKLQRSMSDMQAECQTLAIYSRMDPTVVNALTLGQNSTLLSVATIVQSLQQAEQAELIVQGEVQRWLMGFPPTLGAAAQAAPPPPPQVPMTSRPEPAPVVQHPVQMVPNDGTAPVAAPTPVQMFESPAAAKQAAETQAVAIQQGQQPAPVQTVPTPAQAAPVQANGTPNPTAS